MHVSRLFKVFICCCGLVSANAASAQTATPTPNPENFQSCLPVEDCITNGLTPAIDSCYSASPACVSTNHDKTAVTADQVADRAIAKRGCDTRTFTYKGQCNQCYRNAALPLRFRYDGTLFHGLLAYATKIIENAKHVKCDSLPTRS